MMKRVLVFIAIVFAGISARAQDHWTIQLNSDLLLTANQEDSLHNVARIDDIKKGSLIVTYRPEKIDNALSRMIAIYDDMDRELYMKETLILTLPTDKLKEWEDQTQKIRVYTWPVSKSPNIAIKVRRVHLATIELDD